MPLSKNTQWRNFYLFNSR